MTMDAIDWTALAVAGIVGWYTLAHSVVCRTPGDRFRGCSAFGNSEAGARFTVWLFSPVIVPLFIPCCVAEWVIGVVIPALFGDKETQDKSQ